MTFNRKILNHALFKPSFTKRMTFFLIADFFLFFVSLHIAYALRFDFNVPSHFINNFYTVLLVLALLKYFYFYIIGIYRLTWRFFSLQDAKKLFYAHILTFITFFILFTLSQDTFLPLPRSVIGIDLILSFILIGTFRFSKRIIIESVTNKIDRPTLIIGLSSNTPNLIRSLIEKSNAYYPIAVVVIQEKNRNLIGSTIHGLDIIRIDDLMNYVKKYNEVTAIIDGSLPNEYLRDAYQKLIEIGVFTIQRSFLLSNGEETVTSLSIEDLLARHPKDLDASSIKSFIQNKKVLITGAGGSIGSEISIQCQHFGAAELILIDHSEYNLYQIGEKLPEAKLKLCSIIDYNTIDAILHQYKPQIVIHAAAYKHVPLCEDNISIAIENNIIGSRNIIDIAINHNVDKIVIISTDKAVRPTNVMGATKRVVELYAQNVNPHNSEIVAVRFGNVLGSSGSVIPKFRAQIDSGGPITITHPDITRYFMLISEACQLVLQAATIAKGGELFILDMGKPVKIADLAKTMIKLYATNPIEIVYTGLRRGEKLYEELLLDESEHKTSYESITIARASHYPIQDLIDDINNLILKPNKIEALQKIVPEFKHTASLIS